VALDPGFAHALRQVFVDDLGLCRRVDLSEWQRRSFFDVVVGWVSWQVARL
jgi:hypothetical protein